MLTLIFCFLLIMAFINGDKIRYGIYYVFFIAFYTVCHFFYFLNKDGIFEINLNNDEWLAYAQSCLLLLSTIYTYRVLSLTNKIKKADLSNLKEGKGYLTLLFLYFCGVIMYIYSNGIAFGLSYNDRLEANTGGGLSIILMYAYIPALILYYISKPTRTTFITSVILGGCFGTIYYIVIGGSRNVLAAGVFSLVFLAIYYKHISKKQLLVISVTGVLALILLELYRYANSITDAISFLMNGGGQVLLFTFESFSPIHAVININTALVRQQFEIQYFATFFNEFSIVIPRFLWEHKPINVFNNGYFYTAEILGLETNLTMSPTFLGSCLIMFGSWFYWLGGVFSGLVLFFFDRCLFSVKSQYGKLILLSSIGYLFFWVRDGFEVYCYILIKFGILMVIYFILRKVLNLLAIKK
ncbi:MULTISPECIES: WzyE family oligosaccharide polymerase [Citrobacter]|uniref:WzyE family oligosaccharide polymerase n=1 Tax=Citrobacter TaxID=544 RepID=UPI000E3D601F|nr:MULTISPECIES: WzyE family oligosaccharide polymerase [Citrobacter]MBD0829901.1 WzyE family oligosaccharide polymerase [Citrobacter sp. C1]RFU90115.1 hypothetical protein DZA29_18000 [Citrobacter gillenii]